MVSLQHLVCGVICSHQHATLDVSVNLSASLLVEAENSNMMTVVIETAFSVPETWTVQASANTSPFAYTAALEIPTTAQVTLK